MNVNEILACGAVALVVMLLEHWLRKVRDATGPERRPKTVVELRCELCDGLACDHGHWHRKPVERDKSGSGFVLAAAIACTAGAACFADCQHDLMIADHRAEIEALHDEVDVLRERDRDGAERHELDVERLRRNDELMARYLVEVLGNDQLTLITVDKKEHRSLLAGTLRGMDRYLFQLHAAGTVIEVDLPEGEHLREYEPEEY